MNNIEKYKRIIERKELDDQIESKRVEIKTKKDELEYLKNDWKSLVSKRKSLFGR